MGFSQILLLTVWAIIIGTLWKLLVRELLLTNDISCRSPKGFAVHGGLLSQLEGLSKCAERIYAAHEGVLRQAGVYDVILYTTRCTAGQFPFHAQTVIAFLQFRSPTTNSFHFPTNEELKKITLAWGKMTLKRVKRGAKVTIKGWQRLFSRVSHPDPARLEEWPSNPKDTDWDIWLPDVFLRRIQPDEELVLFLLLWLTIAIWPSSAITYAIKHTCLIPACQIAQGIRLAIAPRVLSDLYRGLGEMVTNPTGPADTSPYSPLHFFIGRLGLYFPWTFGVEEAAQLQGPGILFSRFASASNMANLYFEYVTDRLKCLHKFSQEMYRLPPTESDEDITLEATDVLPERTSDFILSLQPCLLPLREGGRFSVEPDFPQRFARQHGFDQEMPLGLRDISHESRETGVGPTWWYALWVRFTRILRNGPAFLPGVKREVRSTFDYVWWYTTHGSKVVRSLSPGQAFYAFQPFRHRGDLIDEN